MKNTPRAGLVIRIALFYFTAVALCQPIHAQSQIPFRLTHRTLVIVEVTANETGPFDFVFDTGADTTVVDPSMAPQLTLVPLERVQQSTLASAQSVYRASLWKLALGAVHVGNLPVLLQDLSSLRQIDPHIVGLVGQDFLSHFNYLLDYQSHSIRIEQATEIQEAIAGEKVPLDISGNRMFVAAEAQSRNRASLYLLLDSGANSVVLLRSASQMLNLVAQAPGLEMTSSGEVGLRIAQVQKLIVGPEQFHNMAVALPATDPAERIGDGLLPTAFFHALYVNSHDGFVVFNPRVRKN